MMADQRSKRFQSGKEIFRTYVPGFPDQEARHDLEGVDPSVEGAELARGLLEQFGANLSSKISRTPRRRTKAA